MCDPAAPPLLLTHEGVEPQQGCSRRRGHLRSSSTNATTARPRGTERTVEVTEGGSGGWSLHRLQPSSSLLPIQFSKTTTVERVRFYTLVRSRNKSRSFLLLDSWRNIWQLVELVSSASNISLLQRPLRISSEHDATDLNAAV